MELTRIFSLADHTARRTARAEDRTARRALAADLAAYNTPADLRELEAILERHDEADAAPIRALVSWTHAA